MEKNFEIRKVITQVKKNIQMINGKILPGYSELWYVNVKFTYDGQNYKRKFYMIQPEPINIDYSIKKYYDGMREMIYEEVYMNETYEDLKKYIDGQWNYIRDYINK